MSGELGTEVLDDGKEAEELLEYGSSLGAGEGRGSSVVEGESSANVRGIANTRSVSLTAAERRGSELVDRGL